MNRAVLGLLCAALVSACATVWGPKEPFHPNGESVIVRTLAGDTFDGVLIEVVDHGVILEHAARLYEIPFDTLRTLQVKGYEGYMLFTASNRADMARFATYPQGLTPEQRARLLAHRGQAALETRLPRATGPND